MNFVVSIGILAHNEASIIDSTLKSLFQQTLLTSGLHVDRLEIVVVANGCNDETVQLSKAALSKLTSQSTRNIKWEVYEISEAGKSNAWNLFVHNFSNPDAKYLILMDADIQFLEPESLYNMVSLLESSSNVWVSTDRYIKNILFKKNKSILDKISLQASASVEEAYKHSICGQLYCGRSVILREIWMPKGLPVEDGFLRAMILTNRFTSSEEVERVQIAPGASHTYEACSDLWSLVKHEKRIVIGDVINSFLFEYFWKVCNSNQDAGTIVFEGNEKDPNWLKVFVKQNIEERGWWLIPKDKTFRRFNRMKVYNLKKIVLLLPFVCAAFCVDMLIFFQANRAVHNDKGVGYW